MTETAKALVPQEAPGTDAEASTAERSIFISYAHEDKDFAFNLASNLKLHEVSVWIDYQGIRVGDRVDDVIENEILACSEFLVVLSPDARKSDWVKNETQFALNEKKPVLPLLYRQCRIPVNLTTVRYVDFTSNHDKGFAELLRTRGEIAKELPAEIPAEIPAEVPTEILPKPPLYRRLLLPIICLGALLSILIILAIRFLNPTSNTSVTFTRAGSGGTTIYAHVQNTGRAPSTMRSYWLRFGGGPIDDANLVPVSNTPSVIPAGGQADIVLLVRQLTPSRRPGTSDRYTCTEVDSLLKNKNVTLDIGVDESNGRISRKVSFDSFFLHDLINNKLVCREE